MRLRTETNLGAMLRMRIDGLVASMEGLEGQFVPGKMIAYCVVNQDITIRGDIQALVLPNNALTQVDVRQCPQLRTLELEENPIEEIDLRHNPLLEEINLDGCNLHTLDVSGCSALQVL